MRKNSKFLLKSPEESCRITFWGEFGNLSVTLQKYSPFLPALVQGRQQSPAAAFKLISPQNFHWIHAAYFLPEPADP